MSKITQFVLNLLPAAIEQRFRNYYYENKISKVTESDEADLIIVSHLVQEGDVVLDIGSNFGLYTRFLSEYVGKLGKVHAFEPIAKTFISLDNNIKYLKLKNVQAHNLALSDRNGQASMVIPEYEGGGDNMYEARIVEDDSNQSQIVESRKLDDVIEQSEHVAFVKIDVEGHELQALKGGISTLERSKPILLIEINGGIHRNNQSALDILSFLEELGYAAYTRKKDKLTKVTEDLHGFNYFFLTKAQREKMQALILN